MTIGGGTGRLWWPGVDRYSRPEDHPKFHALRGAAEDMVYEWLEAEFRPSTRPLIPDEPPPLLQATGNQAHQRREAARPFLVELCASQACLGRRIAGSDSAGERPLAKEPLTPNASA